MMAWFYAIKIDDWRQLIAESNEYLLRIDPPQEGNRMSAFVKPNGSWSQELVHAFLKKRLGSTSLQLMIVKRKTST